MNYIIRNIDSLDINDRNIWGSKIFYIAEARKHGFSTMDGFCISFEDDVFDENDKNFLKELKEHFNNLKLHTKGTSYIVRSSAQFEDVDRNTFPGIYKSIGNIFTFQDLIQAVKHCYNSQKTVSVKYYMQNMNIEKEANSRFSILIQEELIPEYSGVAFSKNPINSYYNSDCYFVEMVKGNCNKMILGLEKSDAYILAKNNKKYKIKSLHIADNVFSIKHKKILKKVAEVMKDLINIYGENLNIEWGYKNNQITVFQIRTFLPPFETNKTQVLSCRGLKADSMIKFRDLKLFSKKLTVIDKGKDIQSIEKILDDTSFSKEITIRYSCDDELGLPRYFATDKKDALNFIRDTYNNDWTIILHESIDVTHSFELYLDSQKAILEHMPGMWESDNKNSVDVWMFENSKVTGYFVNSPRMAKYETIKGVCYKKIKPFKKQDIERLGRKIHKYLNIIEENWEICEGINFHFVSDKSGKLYFLNQRSSSRIVNFNTQFETPVEIKTYNDLISCSSNNILLKIDLKRGEEELLKEYIPLLKEKNIKVYVEFGILSHPAILLREMGIDVYPYYAVHNKHVFTV